MGGWPSIGGDSQPRWTFIKSFFTGFSLKAVYRSFVDPDGRDNLMATTIANDANPFPTDEIGPGDMAKIVPKAAGARLLQACWWVICSHLQPSYEVTRIGVQFGSFYCCCGTRNASVAIRARRLPAIRLRSVRRPTTAFHVLRCHPWPCMLLNLRLGVDSSPT